MLLHEIYQKDRDNDGCIRLHVIRTKRHQLNRKIIYELWKTNHKTALKSVQC